MRFLGRLLGGDVDPTAAERRAAHRHGRLGATNHGTRRDLIEAKDEALARAAMAEREVRHLSTELDSANDQLRALVVRGPEPDAVDVAERYRRVVQVLTDHEQLADDSCRCRWGADPVLDPELGDAPIWHAEHVARELTPLLVGRPAPRFAPRTDPSASPRHATLHVLTDRSGS